MWNIALGCIVMYIVVLYHVFLFIFHRILLYCNVFIVLFSVLLYFIVYSILLWYICSAGVSNYQAKDQYQTMDHLVSGHIKRKYILFWFFFFFLYRLVCIVFYFENQSVQLFLISVTLSSLQLWALKSKTNVAGELLWGKKMEQAWWRRSKRLHNCHQNKSYI